MLYELDLGLNHVIRKSSEPVDNGANLLIPVPGGEDGPGGVLVCAENYLIYMKDGMAETIQAVIPRRNTLRGDRGVLIVAWAKHQVKTMFFFLLQVSQSKTYRFDLLQAYGMLFNRQTGSCMAHHTSATQQYECMRKLHPALMHTPSWCIPERCCPAEAVACPRPKQVIHVWLLML